MDQSNKTEIVNTNKFISTYVGDGTDDPEGLNTIITYFKDQFGARMPVRPLSYPNREMSMPKEVIVDYTNGFMYVMSEDGETLFSIQGTSLEVVINYLLINMREFDVGDRVIISDTEPDDPKCNIWLKPVV